MKATFYIVLAIVAILILIPTFREPVLMFVYYAPIFTASIFLVLCLTVATSVGVYRMLKRKR